MEDNYVEMGAERSEETCMQIKEGFCIRRRKRRELYYIEKELKSVPLENRGRRRERLLVLSCYCESSEKLNVVIRWTSIYRKEKGGVHFLVQVHVAASTLSNK